MGDVCDMHDCDRFMRSTEGKACLDEVVNALKGRTIVDVTFSNEIHFVATTLHLDDGETFFVFQPSMDVDVLREEFTEALEREYYVDFPERKKP